MTERARMLEPIAATPPAPHPFVRTLTDREFASFRELIYAKAGIHLAPVKKALLVGRLAGRIRELGLGSFSDYYAWLTRPGNEAELVQMLDRVCTNETQFFRDQRQFDALATITAEWRREASAGSRDRRVRVWSAACSTGEEPYSVAMQLLDAFRGDGGWSIEILATDLSTRALARARAGVWPIEKARQIPRPFLQTYMLEGVRAQSGRMKIAPTVASLIRFERLNLNDADYAVAGPFDVILCRNVLIYFDARSKSAVVNRLSRHLHPRGYLFLGQAETLAGIDDRLRPCGPSIYAFREANRQAVRS